MDKQYQNSKNQEQKNQNQNQKNQNCKKPGGQNKNDQY